MIDLEIPLGKRTKKYRFFEMLPALMSYGAIILLIVLSLINPLYAAVYLLLVIVTTLVKALGIAIHTIGGYKRLEKAQEVNWSERLQALEAPSDSFARLRDVSSDEFGYQQHLENLRLAAAAEPGDFPRPSELYNVVIVAAYNESLEVIEPTIQSVVDTTFPNKQIMLAFAYEERGGKEIAETAKLLKKKFGDTFHSFHTVMHPADMPNEVVGKGGNITYAGKYMRDYLDKKKIEYRDVIVTTLDSDNRPHPTYFDYVTYEYIVHEDRKHLSYQPVSLFLNNIWDAPAPMRVIATGNSFWNIISSMRPHTLRNFASHSQPMDALVEMDFWSTRSIVEDGHQYWRSYFHFGGNYAVTPIYVPIYQDAVMADTYRKTLVAQFKQLRRWAYGASDVPYVATRVFTRARNVNFFSGFARFVRLLDSHVTLASVALLIAFGGWVPLLLNSEASRSISAHQLPEVISVMQRVAMVGLFITVFLSLKMLPPRPERYKRKRTVFMVLQWVLMPITGILYNSASSFTSQTRLLFGRYLDKFDVTEKATVAAVDRAKQAKADRADAKK